MRSPVWFCSTTRATVAAVFLLTIAPAGRAAQDEGYVQGDVSAPITIELFSDMTCHTCRELHLETVGKLVGSHVTTGRLRIVHRLVPDKDDSLAMLAARCALASARIGRFEDVTQALFQHQGRWMNDGNLDAVLSQELSVDELKHVRVLVRGEELARSLEVQIAAGRAAGVRLTPTMVIHHAGKKTPIVGAVSHGILTRYLDKLLEKGR